MSTPPPSLFPSNSHFAFMHCVGVMRSRRRADSTPNKRYYCGSQQRTLKSEPELVNDTQRALVNNDAMARRRLKVEQTRTGYWVMAFGYTNPSPDYEISV